MNYSEIRKIPPGEKYPEIVNRQMRSAIAKIDSTNRYNRVFKFRDGVCQAFQSTIEFPSVEHAAAAFDLAEARRWFGDLTITADGRCFFVQNVINDNVYFDNPKKEKGSKE
jgi:hypothetical protein